MSEKTKGVIAYLFGWLGGLIILLGYKDSEEQTKLHAAQAIVLSVVYIVLNTAISFIPVVKDFAGILSIAYFVIAIIGAVKANKLEEYNLPVITELANKWFEKQIKG